MRYYAMWHPEKKWGGPVPVLLEHKRNATMGTGLTLGKIRELGWTWVAVDVVPPGEPTIAEEE